MCKSYSDLPTFVRENIYTLPDECRDRGLTYRALAELSKVEYATVKGYARLEKLPTQIMYNRIAKVFDWRLWR